MKTLNIYNFNYAVSKENSREQLGTISVSKKGDLNISPSVLKGLSTEALADVIMRTLTAYSILRNGTEAKVDAKYLFSFAIQKQLDRYSVYHTVLGKKELVGFILFKNKRLSFNSDVPNHIRNLCVLALNMDHKTDFYYMGAHYDGD